MAAVERTEKEIEKEIDAADESIHKGTSRWPGMTYEDGVRAALGWVIGEDDERPMSDQ